MPEPPKPLLLGQERAAPGEEELIHQIERSITQSLKRTYPPGAARRDAHPKTHGCVRAEFTVLDDLPETLCYGVFKAPRTFDAWIRFSSGKPKMHPDTERDVQGMAIKLMGVEGEKLLTGAEEEKRTQDFVMVNHRVFFSRNLKDYTTLSPILARDWPQLLTFLALVVHCIPRGQFMEFWTLLHVANKDVPNPLQVQYWSQTPYKLGPRAIKFSAQPVASSHSTSAAASASNFAASWDEVAVWQPLKPGPNYMQEAMTNQLRSEDVYFDFKVQMQKDPVKMPVEDPLVAWDEGLSQFQTVARIRIPQQTFASQAQMDFAENLSFTPWHSLPDHQPLGGINRARRTVYEAISQLRHQMNGAPRQEPMGEEVFP